MTLTSDRDHGCKRPPHANETSYTFVPRSLMEGSPCDMAPSHSIASAGARNRPSSAKRLSCCTIGLLFVMLRLWFRCGLCFDVHSGRSAPAEQPPDLSRPSRRATCVGFKPSIQTPSSPVPAQAQSWHPQESKTIFLGGARLHITDIMT